MKTWKHVAIGGLVTFVGLGLTIDYFVRTNKTFEEIASIKAKPKLKKFYKLEEKSNSLNQKLDERIYARVLVDPNYTEKKQEILQNYSDIYRNHCNTNRELEALAKDPEVQKLKQDIKNVRNKCLYLRSFLFPFLYGPTCLLMSMGGIVYTIYSFTNLYEEKKKQEKNKK